jgi:hypothetical protein
MAAAEEDEVRYPTHLRELVRKDVATGPEERDRIDLNGIYLDCRATILLIAFCAGTAYIACMVPRNQKQSIILIC